MQHFPGRGIIIVIIIIIIIIKAKPITGHDGTEGEGSIALLFL